MHRVAVLVLLDTRRFVLLTHNPWFDIIRVTFEKAASPRLFPVGWVNRDRLKPDLLDENWTNEQRGRSLTNHLSWPFISNKINLALMCPYYYIDVNLLWPIKVLSPEDGNQRWCFVFHLNSKQWLMRVGFVVFYTNSLKEQVNLRKEVWNVAAKIVT